MMMLPISHLIVCHVLVHVNHDHAQQREDEGEHAEHDATLGRAVKFEHRHDC